MRYSILSRDSDGNYVSSVIGIYVGPTTSYELDNDGLEFMRSELEADILKFRSEFYSKYYWRACSYQCNS